MRFKPRPVVKAVLWVALMQILLLNISAFLYAYKFTHFYKGPADIAAPGNLVSRTWRLFSGPHIYKKLHVEPWEGYSSLGFTTSGGKSINAWFNSNGQSKNCVIFFHGVTSSKAFFSNESEKFLGWGYSVLLVDFRGHGNSEGYSTSFGMDETEEVELAYNWAREQGYEKVILFGSSMGAATVIKAASEGNIQPEGVIAEMPFASLHDHFKGRARTIGFPSEPFASLVTFWAGAQHGFLGSKHDIAGYAEKITVPVLLQWGDRDHLVKEAETLRIFHNLGSSKKKLNIYNGADHHSYLLTHAPEWERNVQEFISCL